MLKVDLETEKFAGAGLAFDPALKLVLGAGVVDAVVVGLATVAVALAAPEPVVGL